MHADSAFARSLADLNIDPELLLEDSRLATSVLFDHVLEERWLSSDIPTEPTTVETFKYVSLPANALLLVGQAGAAAGTHPNHTRSSGPRHIHAGMAHEQLAEAAS